MVNNGNRYVVDSDGLTNDLGRDIDKLLSKYKNLRWSLYHRYSGYLNSEVEREELSEYIDEQFVKLVKEYNIHSNVDFPGYIKTKLTLRVQNSYIKKQDKYKKNELLGRKDRSVEAMVESTNLDFENSELISYVFDGVAFTEVQQILLNELLSNKDNLDDHHIVSQVSIATNINRVDIAKELTELRDYVRFKVNSYFEQTRKIELNSGRVYTENNVWV